MKKFSSTILVALFTTIAVSQSLEKNGEDEFTGTSIKRTSWEILTQNMKFSSFVRISKLDSLLYLDMKMMKANASVFAIDEGDEIMLKLKSGEVVRLANLEFTTTCTGCGARGYAGSAGQGIKVIYPISSELKLQLLSSPVEKVRIYTTKGYLQK